jgi:hypothetical protein
MAKIQSPSGETEFFQITELQQAFEKELKTGEKVLIAPGVKEASFLREAPVRAEYTEAFKDFKDRLLNPYVPPQPSVTRFVCTSVVRPITLTIDTARADGGVIYAVPPILGFTTTINTTFGDYKVPECNQEFVGVDDGSGNYDFEILPFTNTRDRSQPSAVEIIVPDYFILTAYLGDWTPDDVPTGQVSFNDISITTGLGGGVNYSTGPFSCLGMPAEQYVPNIFQIKADLYVPEYYANPKPYGLTSCSYTLFNYRLTNNYP